MDICCSNDSLQSPCKPVYVVCHLAFPTQVVMSLALLCDMVVNQSPTLSCFQSHHRHGPQTTLGLNGPSCTNWITHTRKRTMLVARILEFTKCLRSGYLRNEHARQRNLPFSCIFLVYWRLGGKADWCGDCECELEEK